MVDSVAMSYPLVHFATVSSMISGAVQLPVVLML